jgi:hypothetical protein
MSLWADAQEKNKTFWRTYTLAQRDQVCNMLRTVLPKLEDEEQTELAEKIIRRLNTQTSDNQLVPFSFEENEILEDVEQGMWRK